MSDKSGNISKITNDDLDRIELEVGEILKNAKKREEEGVKNILKYFDRIHDKLFTFNNILIAGYFALAKLDNSVSKSSILIPIANLAFLVFIEYRMMEKSRFDANITQKNQHDIGKYGKAIKKTNLFSFLTILSTLFVTCVFLRYLLK